MQIDISMFVWVRYEPVFRLISGMFVWVRYEPVCRLISARSFG